MAKIWIAMMIHAAAVPAGGPGCCLEASDFSLYATCLGQQGEWHDLPIVV